MGQKVSSGVGVIWAWSILTRSQKETRVNLGWNTNSENSFTRSTPGCNKNSRNNSIFQAVKLCSFSPPHNFTEHKAEEARGALPRPTPPPIVFKQQKLSQQIIYRLKGNLTENRINLDIGKMI